MPRNLFQEKGLSDIRVPAQTGEPDYNGPTAMAGEQDWLSTATGDPITPRNLFKEKGIKLDAVAPEIPQPAAPVEQSPDVVTDVAKSALYRGVPEGLAASTPIGMALNIPRAVSGGVRWLAGKGYEAITGEELLPLGGNNPLDSLPSSSEVLQAAIKPAGLELYEPKTVPGEYANTATQFAVGAAAAGVPASKVATSAVPAAVASEAAGQATRGTEWETPARFAAALVGGAAIPAGRNAVAKPAIASADDIKALASEKYKLADKVGGTLKPQFTDKYLSEAKRNLLSDDDIINEMKSNRPLRDAFDDLDLFKGQPVSLQRAQAIDEQLGNMVDSHLEMGKPTKIGKKILDAQTTFRNMIDNADESMIVGGKEGFEALKEGRKLWSASARMRDIEKIITRAEMMDQPATGIKTGFRTLYNNKDRLRGFSPEEQALIKKAATTGVVTDALRTFGSRLVPIGAALAGGGLGATIAAQAGSMASRGAAARLQVGRANNVARSIAERAVPKEALTTRQTLNKAIPSSRVEPTRITIRPKLSDKIPRK